MRRIRILQVQAALENSWNKILIILIILNILKTETISVGYLDCLELTDFIFCLYKTEKKSRSKKVCQSEVDSAMTSWDRDGTGALTLTLTLTLPITLTLTLTLLGTLDFYESLEMYSNSNKFRFGRSGFVMTLLASNAKV